RPAVLDRHADDVGRVSAEEERSLAVHRVRPEQRMADRRVLGAFLLGEEAGLDLVTRPGEVVNGDGRLDATLHVLGQRRVRRPPAGKIGGATLRWADARREQRTERRDLFGRTGG